MREKIKGISGGDKSLNLLDFWPENFPLPIIPGIIRIDQDQLLQRVFPKDGNGKSPGTGSKWEKLISRDCGCSRERDFGNEKETLKHFWEA